MIEVPFGDCWITKRARRAFGVGLRQRDEAISLRQVHHWLLLDARHPFGYLFLRRFPSTNTCVQEKFLSLRWLCCGVSSRGVGITDYLVYQLKELFAALQVPFAKVVRDDGIRYSFISYNFCFRRFFDLLGVSHYGCDFPPLKSKKKREDIIILWLKLIAYTKWPYVNSDGKLFGPEHHTDIAELQRRRRAHRRKPGTKSNASDNNNRLRGQCDSSAHPLPAQESLQQSVPDFCSPHGSADVVCGGGADVSPGEWLWDPSLFVLDESVFPWNRGFHSEPETEERFAQACEY